MSDPHILYGMSASLFTGKARAYLLHHGIAFQERGAGHPTFTGEIVPAMGRWIIPVLITPSGDILQDGTAIIDHFESRGLGRHSVVPDSPLLRAVAHLFELFGGEGLLRPAMHYRWGFDDDNLDFLRVNFAEAFPPGLDAAQSAAMFDHSSGRMRKAGSAFGVSDETAQTIEAGFRHFVTLFDAHLEAHRFLLGDRASLGDYGLMNGLFAHLARDPHPALIMKRIAPRVFAWTERMNRPADPEPGGWIADIPDTLRAMMQFVADDFLPEWTAHTRFINGWLDDTPELPGDAMERTLGMAEFDWRGHTIRTAVMPYRLWLVQRLTDHYDGCTDADRIRIRDLFGRSDLLPLIDARAARRVDRRDNREVWGNLPAPF
ncbi:MAG: glutathione S-transferase N-terminal domain-containing protein [Litorimonas sp.]